MKELQTKPYRNAPMDILRTLAILFVICHHLTLNICGLTGLQNSTIELTAYKTILGELLNSFFVIGVNLFFLLSGYFEIRLKKGKIFSLLVKVYFYFICVSAIEMLMGNLHMDSAWEVFKYFLSARNNFWYINTYIAICLVSPALNFIAERLNGRHVTYFIFITVFLFCVWGFLGTMGSTWGINGGYSPLWGSVVYLYGRILKKHEDKLRNSKLFWGIFYLVSTLVNFLGVLFVTLVLKKSTFAWRLFHYNNPLLLVSAVSLLMFFANCTVKNAKIGSVFSALAIHSLGVYVLHSLIPYGFLVNMFSTFPIQLLLFLPNALIAFFGCELVDMLYELILKKPIDKLCNFFETLIIKAYLFVMRAVKKLFLRRTDT